MGATRFRSITLTIQSEAASKNAMTFQLMRMVSATLRLRITGVAGIFDCYWSKWFAKSRTEYFRSRKAPPASVSSGHPNTERFSGEVAEKEDFTTETQRTRSFLWGVSGPPASGASVRLWPFDVARKGKKGLDQAIVPGIFAAPTGSDRLCRIRHGGHG